MGMGWSGAMTDLVQALALQLPGLTQCRVVVNGGYQKVWGVGGSSR